VKHNVKTVKTVLKNNKKNKKIHAKNVNRICKKEEIMIVFNIVHNVHRKNKQKQKMNINAKNANKQYN
jgi:hypothetical protein